MIELLVVLAVTTILTALLLPALSKLHENVNMVRCSNNLRQIGLGMAMYADDWSNQMPPTVKLHQNPNVPIQPQELMASYHSDAPVQMPATTTTTPNGPVAGGSSGPTTTSSSSFQPPQPEHLRGWDGLGLLHAMGYCRSVGCFYCPSHRGDHPIERYIDQWSEPGPESIYINYHYAGHVDWQTRRTRMFRFRSDFIIASDGLRTTSDFNHGNGMNKLYGDGSVVFANSALIIFHMLPAEELAAAYQEELYKSIWVELDRNNSVHSMPNGDSGGH